MVDLTREGYRQRVASLLERAGRARAPALAARLLARALRRCRGAPVERRDVLAAAHDDVRRLLARRGPLSPRFGGERAPRFACDASLGGLARWLRAAGFRARYASGRSGAGLVDEVRRSGELLLTSDSRITARGAARRGELRALWVPVHPPPPGQLGLVLDDLALEPGEPRCMSCGGELQAVSKESVAQRIPPRTARWLDEYFVCRRCDKLFWKGTHWPRIHERLRAARGGERRRRSR